MIDKILLYYKPSNYNKEPPFSKYNKQSFSILFYKY